MALNTRLLSDVWTVVKRQFGDEDGIQITEDDITRATNQGCMEIVSKNKILRASAVADSVTDQDEYDKPADCLRVTSVKYGTSRLANVGFDEFQNLFDGDTVQGTVMYWTQYGDKIILGSAPSDTTVGNIKIYYVPEPVTVSLSTDVLPLPDRYFDRIIEFVLSKMYELDEDWQARTANRQSFEDNLSTLAFQEENNQGPYSVIVPYDIGG